MGWRGAESKEYSRERETQVQKQESVKEYAVFGELRASWYNWMCCRLGRGCAARYVWQVE